VILRRVAWILAGALVVFFAFATFINSPEIVGKFGNFIGNANLELFGYIGFLNILLLFWLLYLGAFKKFNTARSLEVLGIIFIFFGLLVFQAIFFKKGVIGNLILNSLEKLIGVFGVGLIGFVSLLWGSVLIFEDKLFDLFKNFPKKLPKISIKKPKISIPNKKTPPKPVASKDVHLTKPKEIDDEVLKELQSSIEYEKFKEEKEEIKEEVIEDILNTKTKPKKTKQKTQKKEQIKVSEVKELEDTKKLLSQIEIGEREKPKDWKFPPLDILQKPVKKKREINEAEIDKKIKILLEKLRLFKIEGDVVRYYVGPVVTTFEFKPLPHIKVSKIVSLENDLAMALKAKSIRIQAPIPGKDVIGIEIPNDEIETIYLREIFESDIFKKAKSPLTLALGKDVVGSPFVTDLAKLPHLLIAGTTGSGKSVGINAMILSLLYKNSPDELKFVMIDPKRLEFSIYEDIPHLLTPVITDSKKAIVALNAMLKEMERRYDLMAKAKVKNIEGYNKKADEKLPYIVIIIDELADLMMTSGKDVEMAIARLAQMARASGIHLIVATQRPSVDVVTGLIKSNLPSRIAFKVGQKVDSNVILGHSGAETLLGRGDMLFTPPGLGGLLRLHAPFTTEEEIEKVVEFLKAQRKVEYDNSFVNTIESADSNLEEIDEVDELFDEAKKIILKEKRTSISYLQRRLQIGYNRAANIIEQMERMGILSPPNAKGQREILIQE